MGTVRALREHRKGAAGATGRPVATRWAVPDTPPGGEVPPDAFEGPVAVRGYEHPLTGIRPATPLGRT
ncbi:hypothetical protein GCM10010390_07680 [Streptomyces mordarskii]|uniref:Uncharacterized protein n=1 Tax=Streptomyces mordarskii TaxID=1226758 RepID=A0ABN1BXT8_9ACTN